jgi:hypothetical protein
MSCREYLHEKAEESRHNELLATLVFLTGIVFFVGGVLETVSLSQSPRWFLFIPYLTEPLEGAILSWTLVISGILLAVFGISAGLYYSSDRTWYMKELSKANAEEISSASRKHLKILGRKRRTKSQCSTS